MTLLAKTLDDPNMVLIWADLIKILFVMAFGACIGSLTNVLVYRIPLGLDVVTPTSQCPSCETHLTWRENIPIFGWLLLGGRCRFCRARISAEYPLVETFVGLLFIAVFLACYTDPSVPWYSFVQKFQPDWGRGGFFLTWPVFIVVLVLFGSLVAMFLTDAKTFQIPMVLTWVPAVIGVLGHVGHALWVQYGQHAHRLPGTRAPNLWAIATPSPANWWWIGASLGAAVGLIAANLLLWKGIIRRSFADYPQWEQETLAAQQKKVVPAPVVTDVTPSEDEPPSPTPMPAAPAVESEVVVNDPHLWIQYPHARREMIRELIFLAPAIGLGLLGGALAMHWAGPWTPASNTGQLAPAVIAPLWLVVLAGCLMGYLIGGGIVWLVRIGGSLAFGKEAMGLGDVHLLAAVGVCLGWIDAVAAFFAAVVVGAVWGIMGSIVGGAFKRMLPFGPFLAIGTVVVWFGKHTLVEWALNAIAHPPVPIQLP